MLTRRFFAFAAPAVIAASSLMAIRGVALIMPTELSDAEIVALLDSRIDEGIGGWDDKSQRWRPSKYEAYGQYTRVTSEPVYEKVDAPNGVDYHRFTKDGVYRFVGFKTPMPEIV